jgi:hypothetical protein
MSTFIRNYSDKDFQKDSATFRSQFQASLLFLSSELFSEDMKTFLATVLDWYVGAWRHGTGNLLLSPVSKHATCLYVNENSTGWLRPGRERLIIVSRLDPGMPTVAGPVFTRYSSDCNSSHCF